MGEPGCCMSENDLADDAAFQNAIWLHLISAYLLEKARRQGAALTQLLLADLIVLQQEGARVARQMHNGRADGWLWHWSRRHSIWEQSTHDKGKAAAALIHWNHHLGQIGLKGKGCVKP
jgi:hypothetical protein